ncbi:unnamed protein product [Plasmodium vivax]|uniref:(malaria parasite P. vivax) hypothetical protein n=1 Tax=Plasmodium vivax TaxID=5855 RepID=A0A8S4HQ53_PLAVI|nr:unnamed protein product [Plasmodium vivax]
MSEISQINEEEQKPHIFDNLLDKHEEASKLDSIKSYSAIQYLIYNNKDKQILAQLARNIKLLASEHPENYVKRCRDINYWLNKKIQKFKDENGIDISSGATAVFSDIEFITGNNKIVCKREKVPYPTENIDLMKELDNYCEIRNNVRCHTLKNYEELLSYNAYIKLKRQHFRSKMQEIGRETDSIWNTYTIDCKCTLSDLDLTFREINCDDLYKKEELQRLALMTKGRTPLEIGFFIFVSFILFYLFILFLEKFTPVGSIISRFRRRKYDFKRNFERVDDDRYSLYHSDRMPTDSENKRYYIEYSRPQN